MSVIIRLQNLPWSANALDIRQFFHGLSIPEGGVHIVGGELGDAFIAFSTDEDARQAFNLNNGKIKEVQIKLMLSSRTEMHKVIESARNHSYTAFMQTTPNQLPSNAVQPVMPAVIPAAVPELKKDTKTEKRDKRRSRSRSRERKDRERDRDRRDRRRRDRSRSRSRERRDRRRRERSRSRDRTRSKERDHRVKDARSIDKSLPNLTTLPANPPKDQKVGVWESPIPNDIQTPIPPPPQQPPNLLTNFSLPTISLLDERNGFLNQGNNFNNRWNQSQSSNLSDGSLDGHNNFSNRSHFQSSDDRYSEQGISRGRPANDQYKSNFDNSRPLFNRAAPNRNDNLNPRFNERQERSQERIPQDICKDCCVKMRPYYGGFGEVRRFFQGIFIHNTGIKFVNDDYGKRTGIVYIRFAYPEGKDEALNRNGNLLKNQIVEIEHLDDDAFDNTIDRYQPEQSPFTEEEQDSEQSRFRGKNITKYFNKNANVQQGSPPKVFCCLVVEDLPTFAKEQDILKMFSEYPLLLIIMVNKPRKSHAAYVQFGSTDDAKSALQETNKHLVDGKPVSVKPCRDEVFDIVRREQSEIPLDKGPEKSMNYVNSECIYLSRLPLKTNDRDISDFFSDIGIVPTKIHLLHNSMGFSGEAYCEFNSIDEASAAVNKNGMPMGSSNVIVKSADRSEMENTLGLQAKAPLQSLMHNMRPSMGLSMNLPHRPFFPRTNFNSPGPRGPHMFMGPRPRRFPPQHHQNSGDETFGPPGCTVIMENVPYKATVEEILTFFEDFDVPSDNILRRYNPNGKPSGESKVIFKNSDDAYQAVNQKHEHKIRDRTIYLTLC